MKTTIYNQRVEMNNWEIIAIQKYLTGVFNLSDDFVYSDKAIHLDIKENYFSFYKVSNGDDLYITQFIDDGENKTFRLDLLNDHFYQLDNEFNLIDEVENIFE